MTARRPFLTLAAVAAFSMLAEAGRGQSAAVPPTAPAPATAVPGEATPEVPAAPPKITLRWTTASELDNYGFFVMRSDLEEGPFKPLHPKAIPGAGNSEMPHSYNYDDTAVEMGKAYFYYVESVSTRGEREKFTPVIQKTCCKAPGTPTPVPPTAVPTSEPAPAVGG